MCIVTSFEVESNLNITDYFLVREAIRDALVITAKFSKGNVEVATSNQTQLCGLDLIHSNQSARRLSHSDSYEEMPLAQLESRQLASDKPPKNVISFAAVSNVFDGRSCDPVCVCCALIALFFQARRTTR